MWVLIDNYDSFTHILHHYLLLTGHECIVLRNDETELRALATLQPERLIISPGPQTPAESGISMEAIRFFHDKIPILGICLGHQALGQFFGAPLLHSPRPMHGMKSRVRHSGHPLFRGIPPEFEVMRYHSLCIDIGQSASLIPLASAADDGVLMAFGHRELPLTGIQFHPESIGTPCGQQIIDNWAGMFS
ncbi:MAG: aminodeoxychorismate/anthranilate synthase component II [Chitinophagaceae bacterium]|nr:aminodeoxychorismate/anthranilate synthase component II [Chitinophagaceae bacterium]